MAKSRGQLYLTMHLAWGRRSRDQKDKITGIVPDVQIVPAASLQSASRQDRRTMKLAQGNIMASRRRVLGTYGMDVCLYTC